MLEWCRSERYVSLEDKVPIKLGTHEAGADTSVPEKVSVTRERAVSIARTAVTSKVM